MRLAARSLSLVRGPRRLFRDLSFELAPGEALVLRGPNGSGKTSLLRILAGLARPDDGALHYDDQPVVPLGATQRACTLYLGHVNAIKDELTAQENLETALALDGASVAPDAVRDALERVGLGEARRVPGARLSQGQKRRIGMARMALDDGPAGKPIWLLDEPTNALDAAGVVLFAALVDAHLARGGIAVAATHLDLPLAVPVRELRLGEPHAGEGGT